MLWKRNLTRGYRKITQLEENSKRAIPLRNGASAEEAIITTLIEKM